LGENVKIACVVTEVRIVITKNSGAEMAFVKAEDDTGSLELVVFPRIFKETRSYWVDYKPLLVSGRVDSREESPTLIVEAIKGEEEVERNEKDVFIRVPKRASPEELRKLKALLIASPGNMSVTLVFEGKSQKVRLPFGIGWTEELAREISELLEG
jgi:DNA polymerase-3 subunit alpha